MDELDDLLDPQVTGNSNTPNTGGGGTESIPNANAVLTLGILSIALCWLYGIPSLVCGIIGLSLYKNVKKKYQSDPQRYEASHKNAYGGYVCAIIGTSLSALYLLIVIFVVAAGVSSSMRW